MQTIRVTFSKKLYRVTGYPSVEEDEHPTIEVFVARTWQRDAHWRITTMGATQRVKLLRALRRQVEGRSKSRQGWRE